MAHVRTTDRDRQRARCLSVVNAPSRKVAAGRCAFQGRNRERVVNPMMWKVIEREPTRSWRISDEWVVVWGDFGSFRVSRAVGSWIADVTSRRTRPRWIEFVDIVGSLIRMRTRDVRGLYDSSTRVRARSRAHDRALEQEGEEWN